MNKNITEIIFLLDRSGSMAGLEADTIGGFNSFIKKQCKLPGKTMLTTILFDDKYEVLWDGIDASEIKLTDNDYFVRGTTALLDAVGKTIMKVRQRIKDKENGSKHQVIFVITTDGMENSSREFTHELVKELINEQTEHHDWEFFFMGANMDAAKEAGNIGISVEHAYDFTASEDGVGKMYEMVHEVVVDHRKG